MAGDVDFANVSLSSSSTYSAQNLINFNAWNEASPGITIPANDSRYVFAFYSTRTSTEGLLDLTGVSGADYVTRASFYNAGGTIVHSGTPVNTTDGSLAVSITYI